MLHDWDEAVAIYKARVIRGAACVKWKKDMTESRVLSLKAIRKVLPTQITKKSWFIYFKGDSLIFSLKKHKIVFIFIMTNSGV